MKTEIKYIFHAIIIVFVIALASQARPEQMDLRVTKDMVTVGTAFGDETLGGHRKVIAFTPKEIHDFLLSSEMQAEINSFSAQKPIDVKVEKRWTNIIQRITDMVEQLISSHFQSETHDLAGLISFNLEQTNGVIKVTMPMGFNIVMIPRETWEPKPICSLSGNDPRQCTVRLLTRTPKSYDAVLIIADEGLMGMRARKPREGELP